MVYSSPYFANETIQLLREKFNGLVISRNSDINWVQIWFDTVEIFILGLHRKYVIYKQFTMNSWSKGWKYSSYWCYITIISPESVWHF